MQLFKRKTKVATRVGLVMHPEHVALVHMGERAGQPYLLHCEGLPIENSEVAGKTLERLVKKLDLEGTEVSYVLNSRDYHLHLVEAPKVEPEELRAAVRWKIKDLLDMKIEDAAIDVFQVPSDAYRGREMVYVVAALRSRIQSIVDAVNQSGLELAVIDIPELVMKNISTRYLDDDKGLAFMELRRNGSTINISRGGELYLTRRINTQLDQDAMRSANWDMLKDRLVLEIERSLDYFESQMGQGQVDRIIIAQRQKDSGQLTDELNAALQARVSSLDLSDYIRGDSTLTPERQQVMMPAIGATLRGARRLEAEPEEPDEQSAEGQQAA